MSSGLVITPALTTAQAGEIAAGLARFRGLLHAPFAVV